MLINICRFHDIYIIIVWLISKHFFILQLGLQPNTPDCFIFSWFESYHSYFNWKQCSDFRLHYRYTLSAPQDHHSQQRIALFWILQYCILWWWQDNSIAIHLCYLRPGLQNLGEWIFLVSFIFYSSKRIYIWGDDCTQKDHWLFRITKVSREEFFVHNEMTPFVFALSTKV